jgi:hypothetical protein
MTFNIGDATTPQEPRLPIGTVLVRGDMRYIREADGWWTDDSAIWPVSMNSHPHTIESLRPWTETLAQFRQRFAVTALYAAHFNGNGGYREGAEVALRALRIPDPRNEGLRIGSWVNSDINGHRVPRGAVLLSGAPDRAEGYSLFRKQAYFVGLVGPRIGTIPPLMRVIGLPSDYEHEPWPDPEPDDTEQLHAFMRTVWEAGMAEKRSRGWCAMFEASMVLLGLSEEVVATLPGGTVAPAVTQIVAGAVVRDSAELRAAPVGTVIIDDPDPDLDDVWCARKRADQLWEVSHHGPDGDFDDPWDVGSISVHPRLTYVSVPEGPRFRNGTVVTCGQVRSMVPGAVIRYSNDDRRTMFGRTETAEARANDNHTVGIAPVNRGDWSSGGNTMQVVWDGVSPIHETPVLDNTELDLMPVGTVIGQAFDGAVPSASWRKIDAGVWNRLYSDGSLRDGTRTSESFAIGPLRYQHIPVPGVDSPEPALPRT